MWKLLTQGKDKFHDALWLAIPSLVPLLGHQNSDIQRTAASLLEKLAENGELQ